MVKDLKFFLYFFFTLILSFGVIAAPLLAAREYGSAAATIYNLYKPLCHQYIERSFCYFPERGLDDCIKGSSFVSTVYTEDELNYSGPFVFDKRQVGVMRADVVYRGGLKGYKFAVCSRDTGAYWGMFLASLPFLSRSFREKWRGEKLNFWIFLLLVSPLIIDGSVQLLTSWESNNLLRFITGLLAGVGISLALVPSFLDK